MILRTWIKASSTLPMRIERRILRFMEFDLSQLSKLNYKYDPDILVNNVKFIPDLEKVVYSNKIACRAWR